MKEVADEGHQHLITFFPLEFGRGQSHTRTFFPTRHIRYITGIRLTDIPTITRGILEISSLSTTKLWLAGCFFLFSLNEGMLTFRTFRGIMSIYGKPSMVYVGTGPSHTGRRKHKLSSERDDSNG